jgi:hypothetical protein
MCNDGTGDCYTEEGDFGETIPSMMYGSYFWSTRDKIIQHEDPVNNEVGMFEYDDTERLYFLRVDFEQFANPDEISYLISTFSYVDAYTEEEDGFAGFLKGLLSITLFVTGAWLMIGTFGASTPASRKLWQLAGFIAGTSYKQIQKFEMEEAMSNAIEQKNAELEAQQEIMMEEAFRKNRFDIGEIEMPSKINPYDLGLYNPFGDLDLPQNPYTIGGEYYSPHFKLKLGE